MASFMSYLGQVTQIISKTGLAWLLPERCVLCGRSIDRSFLCSFCHDALPWLGPGCRLCACPLLHGDELCGHCLAKAHEFPYERMTCAFRYEQPVSTWVLGLKFQEQLKYAACLGGYLGDVLHRARSDAVWPECLIPVPLHPNRLRERGFNQALEIARSLSKRLHIPVASDACYRIVDTESQRTLSGRDRRQNLRGAFRVDKHFQAKHVALCDDVWTTGSTLLECARVLKAVGVSRIECWCCACSFG